MVELNQAFKLDADGAIMVETDGFGNQSFTMTNGNDTIEQNLILRMETELGEDMLHPEVGIDFPGIMQTNSMPFLEDRFRECIALDPDIATVDKVESVPPERERRAEVSVEATSTDASNILATVEF